MELIYKILSTIIYTLVIYYSLAMIRIFLYKVFGIHENEVYVKRVMIVFGSGGHTTEMLLMIKSLEFKIYREVIFVIGHSDTWSLTKIKDFFKKNRNLDLDKDVRNLKIIKVFRSREVKQSYLTSVFTTLLGLFHSIVIIAQTRPDIVNFSFPLKIQVITNGPGTAVPLCYAHFGFSKLLLWNIKAKILFIESFCRVTSFSLSGKLLYPIANLYIQLKINLNRFVVHWEELKKKHPKTVLFKDKLL